MLVCVGSETADICSAARWIAHRKAFVVTSRYPEHYPPNSQCVCSFVTRRNQRLLVRVVADSVLQWTPSCQSDVLIVYDGAELTMARCGHLPLGLNVTSHTHAILVAFRSDHQRQYKGFWLAVEGHCFIITLAVGTCSDSAVEKSRSRSHTAQRFIMACISIMDCKQWCNCYIRQGRQVLPDTKLHAGGVPWVSGKLSFKNKWPKVGCCDFLCCEFLLILMR